jgi:predicted secreted protein
VRTDPTDNGGLFVGRRPGTAPTKYRALPERGTAQRQRVDRWLAHGLLALEVLITLLYWGPIPAGSLWIAARVQYWTDSVSLAILVAFTVMLTVLFGGLMVLKRIDRAWILVRRAAGIDQRQGVMGRIFAITAVICAVIFGFWFIVINGPGSSVMSGQGG